MSAAVIFVMALATSVTWPIYTYLLEPNGMAYLQTIVFILIIAVLVQLVEIILKKFIAPLYQRRWVCICRSSPPTARCWA